jgi:hypothetical protein
VKLILIAASILIAGISIAAQAQSTVSRRPAPVRLAVRHADPWFVKAMLEGRQIWTPELSTIVGFMGWPPEIGQGANAFFQGGRLIVNPMDNSLWFYPDAPR